MNQTSHPTSVSSVVGAWSGSASALADNSDATYVESPPDPSVSDVLVCQLAPLVDPTVHTGHTLTVRVGKDPETTDQMDVTVQLVNGAPSAVIAESTTTDVGVTPQNITLTLTSQQAALLDYADAHVQIAVNTHAPGATPTPTGAVTTTPTPTPTPTLAPTYAPGALAMYRFTSVGWATFGLALPEGVASDGVQVGSWPTQTDVKQTWPDGSIKYAVVTANSTATGWQAITAAADPGGSFTPTWPTVSVTFTIGGTDYLAQLPLFSGTDTWLNGALCNEARVMVTPMNGVTPHPFLRVLFDVRSYSGGGHRVDVAVNNTLQDAANSVVYDVVIAVGGTPVPVFWQTGVTHYSFQRWREKFTTGGLTEAVWLPDVLPFQAAKALPKVLSTVSSRSYTVGGNGYGILQPGQLVAPMGASGGWPERGPFPDWTMEYLAHGTANQYAAMLFNGSNPSGYFGTHVTESDGTTLVALDDFGFGAHPHFWLSFSARSFDGTYGPANAMRGFNDNTVNDIQHIAELNAAPYLFTGDRWHHDELRYWASAVLLRWEWGRDGDGIITGGSTGDSQVARGIAGSIRALASAAAWVVDAMERAYFRTKLDNNLADLDAKASASADPLGGMFLWHQWSGPDASQIDLWMMAQLVWAINYSRRLGFADHGLTAWTRIVTYQNELFNHPNDYDPDYACPYGMYCRRTDGTYFNAGDWAGLFAYNLANHSGFGRFSTHGSFYGPECCATLRAAIYLGLPNAQANYDTCYAFPNVAADVAIQSRWGLHPDSVGD